ncbi:MAG TPA: FMN-binding protein [Candidatus Saccharimonadales bacterium]|nr:FMN-binding protein [Candidatus Saccharimonadales bacterium]
MKTFKKLALSLGVVLVFIAYSWQQRHDNESAAIKPLAGAGNASTQQATSPTGNTRMMAGNMPSNMMTGYKDGSYTGNSADAYYGYIQVKAVIKSGKLTDVQFLQYPNDQENSIYINQQAMPYLKQEAIKAQSSQVDNITGATDTSQAFMQSLENALNQAKG